MKSPVLLAAICCFFGLIAGCDRQPPAVIPLETQAGTQAERPHQVEEVSEDDSEAVYQQATQLLKQTDQPPAVAFGVAMMRIAADSGHTKAQSITGFHLAQGENKDLPAAVKYLSQAAFAGDKFAAQNLRRLHDKLLEGHPNEKPQVVAALRQAADQGSVPAAAELGAMYYSGSSDLGQDYAQALPLLRQAAEGGDADSANTLGVIYEYGQGIEADKKQAAEFYSQAAQAGHVKAQASLGKAYATGHGVARDPVQAFYWFRLSGRQNEAMGRNALADYIRGLSKDQIREGHRKVAEFLRARGEEVTAAQLDEEIFNPKIPTLEELMRPTPPGPAASPAPSPDDRA